jgi:membrane protease YdiL (CAAX protease family)
MPAGQGIGARATWRVRDIIIAVVMAVVSIMVLALAVIVPATEIFGEDSSGARAFSAVTIAVWDGTLILIVWWRARRSGGSWANLGWRRPWEGEPWWFLKLLRLGAGAYGASLALVVTYNLLMTALGLDELLPSEQIPADFFDDVWLIPLIGASIVITAPIAEELFFRGFVFAGLRRKMRVPAAALLSGFLFSMAHADPGLILPFTLIGAVLAVVYERTGSIWTAMGVHFWFNFVSFVILVAVPDAR